MNRPDCLGPTAERERQAQIIRATRTSGRRPQKPQDNDHSALALFAPTVTPSLL